MLSGLICNAWSGGINTGSTASLRRDYSINQIEYCRNFVFKRHFPIHKIFERSYEMGLLRLGADKAAYIFGVRVSSGKYPWMTMRSKQ